MIESTYRNTLGNPQERILPENITLGNGVEGEAIRIESATPATYFEAISKPNAIESTNVRAHLFLPDSVGPHPVVVSVPGSLGISDNNLKAANLLVEEGIACCLVDPFTARAVSSTVANQAQYSFAASAWDALATAKEMCGRTDIDTSRIGAQGHSRGGTAVLSAACMSSLTKEFISVELQGIYAAYPWCGHQFLDPQIGKTKVRSVIGDLDEWCLPQQVQSYMQAMRLSGGEATWRLFENAHHSFDRDTEIEMIDEAVITPSAPTVYIQSDGGMIHPITGEPDSTLSERDLMIYALKAGYGKNGARIGSVGNQASQFHEDMMSFWKGVFSIGV